MQRHMEVVDMGFEVNLEKVNRFSYLGDTFDPGGAVELAVRTRIKVAWDKWRELRGILTQKYPK